MTIAPAVIRSRTTPVLSVACAALVVYFLLKAAILDQELRAFSLLLGGLAAVVGLWWLRRARRTSVVIDREQFTVYRGGRSASYARNDITGIDLAGFEQHVSFADGTGIKLPLEGQELVEVGFLLTPPRTRVKSGR